MQFPTIFMKNKIKSIISNNKFSIIAFFSVVLLTLIYCIRCSISPFGGQAFLQSDAYHQYGPMFIELINRIKNGESLIYAGTSGLGVPFIGNILNYLSSPFSLIVLLGGAKFVNETVTLITILKIATAAFTFSYFLRKTTRTQNLLLAGFGVMYALSDFFIAYYMNVMWLDAIYMLPLILLGLKRLIEERKCSLYAISLAYTIITNYYMGFMLCIASCIFFLFFYFSKFSFKDKMLITKKNTVEKYNRFLDCFINFALYSLSAGLMAAITLVPLLMVISNSSAVGGGFPKLVFNFSLYDFLANHLSFSKSAFYTTVQNGFAIPNVACGILSLLLLPVFFISKSFTKKEKIMSISVLMVITLSMVISVLDFVWHGFHLPNCFPYRYSFIYIFMFLYVAYQGFCKVESVSIKQLLFVAGGIGLLFVSFILFGTNNHDGVALPVSFVLLIIFLLLLIVFKQNTKKTMIYIACFTLILGEFLIPNLNVFGSIDANMFYYYNKDANTYNEIISKYDDFERIDILGDENRSAPYVHNYNGISTFSSMNYHSVSKLMYNLGYASNSINSIEVTPTTPYLQMLTSSNYLIEGETQDVNFSKCYNTLIKTGEKSKLYKSNYPTNIGFAANKKVTDFKIEKYNPFNNQNKLFEKLLNTGEIIHFVDDVEMSAKNASCEVDSEDGLIKYKFDNDKTYKDVSLKFETKAPEKGHYYAYLLTNTFVSAYKYGDNKYDKAFYDTGMIDLGVLDAGETIVCDAEATSETNPDAKINFFVVYIKDDEVDNVYNKIVDNGMFNIAEYKDSYIKATINSKTDFIYTNIPYDKNWNIYIDGEKLSSEHIYAIGDALIGFDINAGQHTVEFKYNFPYVYIGVIVSIIGICGFLLLNRLNKKQLISFAD